MWCFHRFATRITRSAVQGAMLSALVVASSGYMAAAQSTSGRVTLEVPDLPPATVEIDLGQGLIRHSLSLGDAAIAGFLDGLMTSPNAESSENAKYIAEQLTSARELGDAVAEVLHEVHVRVWDDVPNGSQLAERLIADLDASLVGEGWESALRVREDGKTVRIYIHRSDDSLSGVQIVAAEQDKLAVVNLVGDLSPDKVQHLTATATKIGVKLGLDKEINRAVEELRREIGRQGR